MLPGGVSVRLSAGDEVLLGRESDVSAITRVLESLDTVSRRHARLAVRDGAVEVSDLGSANGTFIEGRPLGSAPVVRKLPVRIGLGRSVTVEVT